MARGGWQHIAVSFDQTSRKVKFYVNGALDSEKNMGTSAVNAVTALLVGSHKNIGTMDPHSMKGDVDDIRVYDATLTDDQAAAIYAEQGTALVRKQLGTLVSQADALLAAGEVDAASAQAQALATAKRNAVNAMNNTSGSAVARMTAMNAAGTALQTAITAYQAHVPITLTADPSTVERTVDSASIFGVNHRYAFNGYGSFDPDTMRVKDDFTALYKQVGFGSIRYPGGTISNLFNWKTTIGPRAQRLKQIHGFYNNPGQGGIEPNFGIGEIATFADEVDSEIVYVYSLGRGNAQDAADLIEYLNAQVGTNPNGGIDWAKVRADNGHPQPYNVRYFEIGNEMQHHALGDRLFETRIQFELEIGRQHITVVARQQLGIGYLDLGGPGQSTTILVYKVYLDGFKALDLGGSAAQSVILMLIVVVLTVIQFRYVEKKVQY